MGITDYLQEKLGEIYSLPLPEEGEEINKDDIDLIVEQTGKTTEEAKKALEETNGDIAEAIIKLTK